MEPQERMIGSSAKKSGRHPNDSVIVPKTTFQDTIRIVHNQAFFSLAKTIGSKS